MSCLSLNLFSRINVPSSFTPRHRTRLPLGHSSTFPSGGLSTGVTSRSPGSAPTSKAGLPWPRHVLAYAVPRSRSPFFQSFDYQNSILPPTSLLLSGLRDTAPGPYELPSFDFIIIIFNISFRFTTEGEAQRFPTYPWPRQVHSLPRYQHPPPDGTFATVQGPTPTHNNRPESTPSTGIHCWSCTFYGFGQMYNDSCPLLRCHTEEFRCSKNPRCSSRSSLCAIDPQSACVSIAPPFPGGHIVGIMQRVAFPQT